MDYEKPKEQETPKIKEMPKKVELKEEEPKGIFWRRRLKEAKK